MNLGLDINTECIAYAYVAGAEVIALGTLPFKGEGPKSSTPRAKDRLPYVGATARMLDEICGIGVGRARADVHVRIEEPAIGQAQKEGRAWNTARSSMLVGLFNGVVYGVLDDLEYPVELVHVSTWKADLRHTLGLGRPISSKPDVVAALKYLPGLEERVKAFPRGVQQDLWDACGLAVGGH